MHAGITVIGRTITSTRTCRPVMYTNTDLLEYI